MEVIEFKKVYFSYETGEKDGGDEIFGSDSAFAVNGVDFTAREGEFIAILGHNGSGKSTLARLANGLLTPNDGEVTAFGLSTAEDKNLFEIKDFFLGCIQYATPSN